MPDRVPPLARARPRRATPSRRLRQLDPAALDHVDELLVRRPACPPALEDGVPRDLALLGQPTLLALVELLREWGIDDVCLGLRIQVRRNIDADRLAERHRR